MTPIYLTDEEVEKFKEFREYQQSKEERALEHQNWRQLKAFAKDMQYGVFTVTIKEGIPVRIDQPMRQVIFSIKT